MGKKKVRIEDYHVVALRRFGNTIISVKYNHEDVIAVFKEYDLDVVVHPFERSLRNYKNVCGWRRKETHNVVEVMRKHEN